MAGLRASRAAIKTLEHARPKPEQEVHVPLDDNGGLLARARRRVRQAARRA